MAASCSGSPMSPLAKCSISSDVEIFNSSARAFRADFACCVTERLSLTLGSSHRSPIPEVLL